MPSLFDEISGFQFPDVLMNSGPLPSTAGGPAGSNGSVDGVINGTSALLDNIVPYAIGRSARTGSDRNYQQIPHRYQYIIPKIWLPDFTNNNGHIAVSHAVDQGDIAFLLYGGSRAWWTSREQFAPRAPQCAFAGIDVVNYILACIQASRTDTWERIRQDMLGRDELFKAVQETAKPGSFSRRNSDFDGLYVFNAVRMLVQQYFVPHGICAGSERQGGQHEHDGGQSVIAPVNFVITMTVDGKNVDLVNYWYDKSMLAGDELIFRLEKKEVNTTFNLSSYYKQSQQTHVKTPQPCWQLVPDLLRQKAGADPNPCRAQNAWYHHRCQGYWRVAQTFQTRAENNINAFHRGMPLEVTFAPVWQSFTDCRDVSSYGKYSVDSTTASDVRPSAQAVAPVQQHDDVHEGRDDRHRHAQHDHRARARRGVCAKVEADYQRDARAVHDGRAARDHAAALQHHAPQQTQHDGEQKEHARHGRLLQTVLVPHPRKREERAHDHAQRDRRKQHLRAGAPRRRHRDHRKVHAEHLDAVRELVPEQRGGEVVVPRRVRGQHVAAPALRVRRVVHPHDARQQSAARERHHDEYVVHHDRRARRGERQRQRRRVHARVRVRHRRLVDVPVHQRDRRRPVELAEERVSEEDRVERHRQRADVENHGLAPELGRVHAFEERATAAAALALFEEAHKGARDVRHLPAQAHETKQHRDQEQVRGVELELHALQQRILKSLACVTFYCVLHTDSYQQRVVVASVKQELDRARASFGAAWVRLQDRNFVARV